MENPLDGLVLPGGESTVQGKLLADLGLLESLRERIKQGLPVLATCAGLILLAENVENQAKRYLGTLPVTVKRNAYGRQLGSFTTAFDFADLGQVPATFIRAPCISEVEDEVEILSKHQGKIIAARYRNQIELS